MSTRTRRKFSTEKRAAILLRHLRDKVSVSELCEEYSIQPSLFYTWQRQVFDNLETVLTDGRSGRRDHAARRMERLEQALAEKDAVIARKEAVIAEVTEEYVGLKNGLRPRVLPARKETRFPLRWGHPRGAAEVIFGG